MASSDVSPEDAFAALGNEHRVEILRVFADAESSERRTLSFSEIYDRVGIEGTNQLAYHLGKLEGVFLRRSDRGYSFTHAGDRVVREILAGSYDRPTALEATTIEGYCPSCGCRRLRASYEDPLLEVSCTGCEQSVVSYDVAPGQRATESPEDLLRTCDRRVHHEYRTALENVCPDCGGRTEVEIERNDSPSPETHYAVATCRTCARSLFAPLAFRLLFSPRAVAFHRDRGVDLGRVPFYRVTEHVDSWDREVESTDPLAVAFTFRLDGDELSLRVNEDLDVEPV